MGIVLNLARIGKNGGWKEIVLNSYSPLFPHLPTFSCVKCKKNSVLEHFSLPLIFAYLHKIRDNAVSIAFST